MYLEPLDQLTRLLEPFRDLMHRPRKQIWATGLLLLYACDLFLAPTQYQNCYQHRSNESKSPRKGPVHPNPATHNVLI